MPRKTHPHARQGRDRAMLRHHTERVALKRWRRTKQRLSAYWMLDTGPDRYPYRASAPVFTHPDEIRSTPEAHPYAGYWLRSSLNEWSRNPQTYCSCRGCTAHAYDAYHARSVQREMWMQDWEDEDIEAPTPGRRHHASGIQRRDLH